MGYLDFSHSLNKREYMIGRTPETDYYIITYKENKSNYLVLLLKNHKEIHRNYVDGLTKAKFYSFETLLNINKKMFENKNVTMLHYKDDRPNGNPWVKDTVKELNKNLEEYYKFKGYKFRENIGIINKKNDNESIENLKKKFHYEMLNITEETKKFGYNPTRFKQMVLADGGYNTAKKLLANNTISDGFSVLWENKALKLSVEAIILKKEYITLFTDKEISIAKERLNNFEYKIEEINDERSSLKSDDTALLSTINSDLEAEQIEEGNGIEGTVKYYYGKHYERDSKNRRLAIKKHGKNCVACGFNFEKVYGERGKDFIEVHHIKPLSTLKEAVEINPETDLVPLCANCHRMVHRRKDDILSIDELKKIITSGLKSSNRKEI